MKARFALLALLILILTGSLYSFQQQRRWQRYEREMQDPIADPPDAWEKSEFAFARLRYRSPRDGRGFGRFARWGTDANKSERQFIQGLRRLTRVHGQSVEEIVDIDSDEIFNWPWMYAVGVGDWVFDEPQAARLRQYFERGGFLMVDDFHNEFEWAAFMAQVHKFFPESVAIDIPDDHPIFQVAYDLRQRYHVPGYQIVYGQEWERGGIGGHWRAITDKEGRVQIAICFNMDLGDAWEWADSPEYPEKYSAMAYRIGVNYVLYSLTH